MHPDRALRLAEPGVTAGVTPPIPLYADDLVRIYCGDLLEVLPALPPESVDLVVTSPPYNVGAAYDRCQDALPYPGYLGWVQRWATELLRVAAPSGRLAINVPLDTTRGGQRPVYGDILHVFQQAGWIYRTTIIWNETNISKSIARGSVDSCAAPHIIAPVEMIAIFFRGDWRRPPSKGQRSDLAHDEWLRWTNGLWTFSGESAKRAGHPAPFPEELPRRLIKLLSFPGDTVLDPFLGSGTTCWVAKVLGRRSIGIDLSAAYCRRAAARCSQGLLPSVTDNETAAKRKCNGGAGFAGAGDDGCWSPP